MVSPLVQLDLLLAAQKRGLEAEIQRGELALLKSELERGHPMFHKPRGAGSVPVGATNPKLGLLPVRHFL
jgi:hypothetical protein